MKPHKSISGWSIEDEGKYDEQQSLMEAEKIQQQKKMEADLEFEQQLLAEREQRIQQIEADMLDINSVFRDLAALVHEQGATIDTIESNVEAVAENTARGTEHLSKASRYQVKCYKVSQYNFHNYGIMNYLLFYNNHSFQIQCTIFS
ncbi:syntaxin-12-like [Centruroides sculpturatus]|uniref:syntaxin-12-like n=1 Tax=Centruroides sculpturatus TaxID=218467 RepID=UPI000C6D44ED|nr:syntaxin-12-like [Centruroides sculpturatus]XP_023234046.1 syntaxin-12-like [Centruroides sculpturatus]